ncbi:BnaC04g26600D [Brassica napus]|uniref:BnaC04g26600D protein n=1 Tax=Brassica napus TaxID=3708 RepID=A0A078FFK7_BRANA|nr:BnaC04g26600D [Brassica napus]
MSATYQLLTERRQRRRINKKTEAMSYSSLKLPIFLILSSLLHAALGEEIICENLPTSICAFSISATGKRCLLETANVAGEYTCRNSAVEVEGIVNHVESDECVAACGVDRKTVGISSDAMMEPGFAAKLCSPACFDYCPNILDLYFNLAAGEGKILSFFLFSLHAYKKKIYIYMEMFSSGGAPEPAPGPVSDSSAPALAPAAM